MKVRLPRLMLHIVYVPAWTAIWMNEMKRIMNITRVSKLSNTPGKEKFQFYSGMIVRRQSIHFTRGL